MSGRDRLVGPSELASTGRAVRVRGYEPDPAKRWTAYYLGMAIAVIALFGMVPAILDVVDHFGADQSQGVTRWAYVLLLAGTLQLAYALYLVQLPDWSTVWVVTVVSLLTTTAYAVLLGIALLASGESQIISLLQLGDPLRGGKALPWCFIMTSITSLLAYFSGRIAVRWHQAYQ